MAEIQAFAYSLAIWLIPLVIAIVCHEVAHGLVAHRFGDNTAADQGRLSFNPLRHVDPIGTVVLPLVLALSHAPIFGWAKPVPVRPRHMRNPRVHMMIVALAGPAMNFALAALAAVLLATMVTAGAGELPRGGAAGFVADNLTNFFLINIFLAVFNLLPIPPFDGGHVVQGLLPRKAARHYGRLARFGFPIMLLLLVVLPMIAPQANIVQKLVAPVVEGVARFFLGLVNLPF